MSSESPRRPRELTSGSAVLAPFRRMTTLAALASSRGGTRLIYPLSFVLGLLVWEVVASLLPRVVFAAPSRVFWAMVDGFASGAIPLGFLNSLQHMVAGLALAIAVAMPLGFLLGRNRTAATMFDPVVNAFFAIPSVAFVPFIMIWFGLFYEARVALVFFMCVFDVLITVSAGARNIDPAVLNVARSFQVTGLARLRKVLLPASLPFVFTALRIGVVRAVNAMITAELFFAAVNLGAIMQTASSRFDAPTMLGVVFLVSLFGLALQEVVKRAEVRLLPWSVRDA
ncbi:ABC transporter permease [Acuticoccus sp.]|uniref:ABC transporter permease n=1 Tax=Acuticoccus sp. TaxID=1904378 RepID=UPI003B51D71D